MRSSHTFAKHLPANLNKGWYPNAHLSVCGLWSPAPAKMLSQGRPQLPACTRLQNVRSHEGGGEPATLGSTCCVEVSIRQRTLRKALSVIHRPGLVH